MSTTLRTKLTPVRYPGGKSNALPFLKEYLPVDYAEWREPFFGGGSVGLFQMQRNKTATYWINDLFYPVYCFWNIVYHNPEAMVVTLLEGKRAFPNKEEGRALHKDMRTRIIEYINAQDELSTACAWYVLNKTSYSGLAMAGSYAPLAWDQNFTENCIIRLPRISLLMHSVRSVKITNLDYTELLSNTGENVFVFLDPPYAIRHNLYGDVQGAMHRNFNHEEFALAIQACQHRWTITYNASQEIKDRFSKYQQREWQLTYTMKAAKRLEGDRAKVKGVGGARQSDKTGKCGKELLVWNWEGETYPVVKA